MKKLLYLIPFAAALGVLWIFAANSASAQVSGSLWKLQANYLNPVNSSWGVQVSSLANNNCLGTDASGKFQTGTCGGGGTATSSFAATWPVTLVTSASNITYGFNGLSTSTAAVIGNIPYFSGVNTFANVATTTLAAGANISFSGGTPVIIGSSPITISAVAGSGLSTSTPIASSNLLVYSTTGAGSAYGVATSTLTASSPLTGSFVQIGSGGSLGCQTASGAQAGCLSSTDWTTFNNKVSTTRLINTTYPLQGGGDLSADRTLTIAFGTTTSNTWAGTQTFTNSPVISALGTGAMYTQSGTVLTHATTSASAASQDVWRDANQNAFAQNFVSAATSFPTNGGTVTLTVASPRTWIFTGTNTQTMKLPVGTTLSNGSTYYANNNSTGVVTVVDNGSNVLSYVPSGGHAGFILYDNSTSNGSWDSHAWLGHGNVSGTNGLGVGTTSPYAQLSVFAGGNYAAQAASTLFAVGSSSAGTATSTLFSILSSGNVGIGTTSPSKLLLVEGNQSGGVARIQRDFPSTPASSAIGTYDVVLNETGAGSLADGTGPAQTYGVMLSGGSENIYSDVTAVRDGADTNGKLYLRTYNAGNPAIGLTIDHLQNVGIGTTTPTYQLTVASSTAAQLSLSAGAGVAQWTARAETDGSLDIATTTIAGTATTTPAAIHVSNGGQLSTQESVVATSTAMTIDWNTTANQVVVRLGTSATTIGFNNASTTGMTKRIVMCNPGGSAGALTWSVSGISWPSGTVPTQTTTSNQCDIWSFIVTAATSTTKIMGAQTAGFQ